MKAEVLECRWDGDPEWASLNLSGASEELPMLNRISDIGVVHQYKPHPQLSPNLSGETNFSPYHSDLIPKIRAHSVFGVVVPDIPQIFAEAMHMNMNLTTVTKGRN